MMAMARGADAGDLREPLHCGQNCRVRAGVRGLDAVGGDAAGGGDGVQRGFDLVLQRGDRPVQQGDVVQVDPDQHAVVLAGHHAVQGPGDGGAAALDVAVDQRGQGPGVVLAVGEGFQDVAGGLDPGQPGHHG